MVKFLTLVADYLDAHLSTHARAHAAGLITCRPVRLPWPLTILASRLAPHSRLYLLAGFTTMDFCEPLFSLVCRHGFGSLELWLLSSNIV